MRRVLVAAALGLWAAATLAGPAELLSGYEAEARRADPAFAGFSAGRGERFFASRHANDWSCSTCHGAPPVGRGRHASTGKSIAPLAPAANPERFTDARRTEKWFRRNCNDVVGRACTAAEKGDILTYLMQVRP